MILRNCILMLLLICIRLEADSLRVYMAGKAEISPDRPEGSVVLLSYTDSALISLTGDPRFYRGIQLDLTAPAGFLAYRGHLASVIYNNLNNAPETGIADIQGQQLSFEPLAEKILNTWQIPLRDNHGLRSSPYVTIPTGVVPFSSFPVIFRLMPVIKGISDELEKMVFQLTVKPVLGDEGIIRLKINYPEQLPGRPFTVLIDDEIVGNLKAELLLKEGEHHLVILSDDYRNQSRRFMVEKARVMELLVELQDPTPLLIFESPEGAGIYVNNRHVANTNVPYPVEPGLHEVKFQMSNYSIIRPITVQKGKTYKIALSVDINITEND